MRICMLTSFYPPWNFGGDGIQVQRLSRALASRGHDVTVVHSREGFAAMGGDAAVEPEDDGVRLVSIDTGTGRGSPLATYLSGRPLITRWQIDGAIGDGFDVLHFHNPSLLGGPGLLAHGSGIKLYTAHEQWLVCPMHVLWQDRRRVCERPHCVRCSLRHHRPPQPWRATGLLERSLRHLDALIVPSATSELLHRRLAARAGVEIQRIAHFTEDPGAPMSAGTADRPYVLFAGRLEPIKGVETVLRAFSGYRDLDLLIAGTGSLEGRLRAAAAELDHVRFTGWCDRHELDRLYRGALAVVVPTLGHEAFGLVAVEALARGVPAIVRDFGALGELAAATDAVIGYRSDDDLVAAIEALRRDPARRRALGRASRAAYLERWTEATHVEAYLALVARLAAARGESKLATEAARAAARERTAA